MVQKDRKETCNQPIYRCVENALKIYFEDMDGHNPSDLYEFILSQTEKPLLAVVLKQAQGNLTKSATILGINRATLRKKLIKYDLL